jgi:hypothetical protein
LPDHRECMMPFPPSGRDRSGYGSDHRWFLPPFCG